MADRRAEGATPGRNLQGDHPGSSQEGQEEIWPDEGARCWALILAAGAGERLGMESPKAFVPLGEQPLLRWSVEAYARHPQITDVLVVVPSGWEVHFRDQVLAPVTEQRELSALARIHSAVAGGPRRQDSSRLGLESIRSLTPDSQIEESIVLIHDAARPVVPPALISNVITALRQRGPCAGLPRSEGPVAVVPVVPVEDTLKAVSWPRGRAPDEAPVRTAGSAQDAPRASGGEECESMTEGDTATEVRLPCGQVSRTVPRKGLWRAQTPQGFFLRPVLDAHQEAARADSHATDDVTLYEMNGWPVEAIPGSRLNLKVALREDLVILEAWLAARRAGD